MKRVTPVLAVLTFVVVVNTVLGGLHLIASGHPLQWDRLAINLAASLLLSAWALRRLRAHWRAAASPGGGLPSGAGGAPRPGDRPPAPGRGVPSASQARAPWLRWARTGLSIAMITLAAVTIVTRWPTLQAGLHQLGHLHWRSVRLALYAEALAMIAFAVVMLAALRAGGSRPSLGSMISLTLAANAISITLPGGPAWSATFSFDQLRRRGVRRSVSAFTLSVTWVLSAAAIISIALVGIDLAADGPAAGLRWPITALLAVLALAGAVVLRAMRTPSGRANAARRIERICAHHRWGTAAGTICRGARELGQVRLTRRQLVCCVAGALLNWLLDCGCLACAIVAVSGHVPWTGLLAAYGLTQLAAALPITPGGLGVVEGTLSLLLVAYGLPADTAIAAVMLYRIISFWALLPIGWAAIGMLTASSRRGVTIPLAAPGPPGRLPQPAGVRRMPVTAG